MRALIAISKRGDSYIASAQGKFGGGYQGCYAGENPTEAAAFAVREMGRYAIGNSEGGDLMAPIEVYDLVPEKMKSVDSRR